jgi:hypothetical protein
MPFNLFSVLTSKIFGGLSIALLIALAVCWHGWGVTERARDLLAKQVATIVFAVRQASGNETVTQDTAAGQVIALGDSNRRLKGAIAEQNLAIDEMAAEAVRAKAHAAELKAIADKAEAQRRSALRRLSDMSITPGTRSDCLTLLREAEDALDTVRSAGA